MGEELILGVRVIALRAERPSSRVTRWLAEELACEPLRYVYEEKDSKGVWRTKIEHKAVSLVTGEPDPSLFSVPDSYREQPPSAATHAYNERMGVRETEEERISLNRMDEQYYKQKP